MKIGKDGITGYHRVRGRPFTKRLIQFGEVVLAQLHTKGPDAHDRGKLDARWSEGVMLGYGSKSPSYWIGDADGVRLVRSVKRLPTAYQWNKAKIEDLSFEKRGTHVSRGPRAVPFGEPPKEGAEAQPVRRRAARVFEIRQKDLDPNQGGIGWTEGCPACDKARRCRNGWSAV